MTVPILIIFLIIVNFPEVNCINMIILSTLYDEQYYVFQSKKIKQFLFIAFK